MVHGSLDGLTIVTGSNDNTAKVWDGSTGGLVATLGVHGGSVTRRSDECGWTDSCNRVR